ncbi:hypothetical protein KY348_04875 [Candidatus Woesearchaeota archaeon]|nr:hypothetical protein [Candidatus Woesearchaeota archaeon]
MKRKSISLFLFLATLVAITIPLAILSGAQTDNFDANVSIQNSAPVIGWVNDSVTQSPNDGSTSILQIHMNVTDTNGVSDINTSDCFMNITRTGETTRTSSVCFSTTNSSNTQWITCNITISWYDVPGEWVITAFATDDSGVNDTNNTSNFTMGNADYVDVINASIRFASVTPGQQNAGPRNIIINNTGNQNYTEINLTGYDLTGVVSSNVIGVSNFTVNVTDGSGEGQALVNNTEILVTSASLDRESSPSGATEEFYFYLDVPSGLEDDEYSAGTNWLIDPAV